jgi:hypothetical protein
MKKRMKESKEFLLTKIKIIYEIIKEKIQLPDINPPEEVASPHGNPISHPNSRVVPKNIYEK